MTEVEAHVALVCASTNDGRPLTGSTNFIWMVVTGLLQVVDHALTALINAQEIYLMISL